MSVLQEIARQLDSVGIKYQYDQQNNFIGMRWQTDHFDDLRVRIVTNRDESWLYIVAPFGNFYKVDSDKQFQFAIDMLKESWRANGVKMALDDDNDIIVIAETNDRELTGEELRQLVGNVVHACDKLWDIYPA
ncbi:MAG: hypothetical protein QXS20_05800 [Candidatus Thorarchaeota archaeon]